MVETVSAQPLTLGPGIAAGSRRLEPGVELKATVETNLPGGVVRLATADAKLDLRVQTPLPPGSEVVVTVSGSRQNPAIQITAVQAAEQPGKGAQPTPLPQVQNQAPGQGQTQPQVHASPQNLVSPQHQALPQAKILPQLQGQPPSSPQQVLQQSQSQSQSQSKAQIQAPTPSGSAPAVAARLSTAPGSGPQLNTTGGASQSAPGTTASSPGPQSGTQTPLASEQVPRAVSGQLAGRGLPLSAGQPPQQTGSTSPTGAQPVSQQGAGISQEAVVRPTGSFVPPVLAGTSAKSPVSAQPDPVSARAPGIPTVPSAAGTVSGSTGLNPAPLTGNSAALSQPSQGGQIPGAGSSGASSPSPAAASAAGSFSSPAASPPEIAGTAVRLTPGQTLQGIIGAAPRGEVSPAAARGVVSPPLPVSSSSTVPPSASTAVGTPGASAAAGNPPVGNVPASGTAPAGGQVSGATGGGPAASIPEQLPNRLPGQPIPVTQAKGPASTINADTARVASPDTAGSATSGSPARTSEALPQARFQAAESVRVALNQPYRSAEAAPSVRLSAPVPAATPGTQNPVREIARQLVQPLGEQQSGLGNLFAQVGALATAQASGQVSLPDPVVKAMQQILGLRLNTAQQPSAGDVRQAVRFSGQFREAQLALPGQGQPGGQADLKSVLLSFKSLLQQFGAKEQAARPANQPSAPTLQGAPQPQAQQSASGFWAGAAPQNLQSLLKETDAALARMRLTQLVNSGLAGDERPGAATRPMDVVLELPLSLGQETAVMQMQIGRDGGGQGEDDDTDPAWRLRFALDLTATGPLEAAVSLRGGGTFVSLWVDRKETFDSLNAVRETVEASFADAGLDLQEFRLVRGLPPRTAAKYGALVDRQS